MSLEAQLRQTSDWSDMLRISLAKMDKEYQDFLATNRSYFPDRENFLNAFKTLPKEKTKYILFGQDPYPREESAIGYAFIDGAVTSLWDAKNGLSKEVNRATSLRNFIKMLLVCEGVLSQEDTSKKALESVDTSCYIDSIHQLRENFEKNGVLLLNMALVFTDKEGSKYHVQQWRAFIQEFLYQIRDAKIELILFGSLAQDICKYDTALPLHIFEHPYNLSFITNKDVQAFFAPMHLLNRDASL